MNNKVFCRLEVVKELDDFKKRVVKLKENEILSRLIEKLSELDRSESEMLIEFPDNIESIVHLSISKFIPKAKMLNKKNFSTSELFEGVFSEDELSNDLIYDEDLLDLESYDIDWDNIGKEIRKRYDIESENNIYKDNDKIDDYLKFSKMLPIEYHTNLIRTDIILILLKEIFCVVNEFFPIEVYGLPSDNFIGIVSNLLLDNKDISVVNKLTFFNLMDPYKLKLKQENSYLISKLKKLGVDVEKEMFDDGFTSEQALLDDILLKSPLHYIRLEGKLVKKDINDESKRIIECYNKYLNKLNPDILDFTTAIDTIKRYAEDYADMRFNQRLPLSEIYKKLSGKYINYDVMKGQINKMAEMSGFIDLHNEITIENSKGTNFN